MTETQIESSTLNRPSAVRFALRQTSGTPASREAKARIPKPVICTAIAPWLWGTASTVCFFISQSLTACFKWADRGL